MEKSPAIYQKENGSPDRISVSLGVKQGLPNYSSRDYHISYSTDVAPGEHPDDTTKRAYLNVLKWLKNMGAPLLPGK
jgi:hypothetical protein